MRLYAQLIASSLLFIVLHCPVDKASLAGKAQGLVLSS